MGIVISSALGADSKLYELRCYKLAAQDAAKFKALACANLPVRVQRSRLVGFWETEIGAINHVLHMWEYASLNHRKAVRDDMATQADWTGFEEKATPMYQVMDNRLCKSLLGDLTAVWSDKDFYKITTVRYQQVWRLRDARHLFLGKVDLLRKSAASSTVVMAALETVVGAGKEFILIESARDLQHFLQGPGLFDDSSAMVETKILYPYPWSEWAARN